MKNLCTEIGCRSVSKRGEELCGDHVATARAPDGTDVLVLADGLGSGVKASILSTLTSRMLCTMISEGIAVEECVTTMINTLPVSRERGVAYSTFTVIRIIGGETAELVQYDNPAVLLLREGRSVSYASDIAVIDSREVYLSRFPLYAGDVLLAVSDGAVHAGIGRSLDMGLQLEGIEDYMLCNTPPESTARTLAALLLDRCCELYGGEPGDDTTVCAVRIRKRAPVNLMIGPPADPNDCRKMLALFYAKEGRHIICGGTTSHIAAEYLGAEVTPGLDYVDPEIPPTATLDGADLVTEGVITINRVLAYAQDYLAGEESYKRWLSGQDGASLIARMLFEEATDINLFVGRAVNPAHQDPSLPINFDVKMRLVNDLADCLKKMGKRVKVSNF